MRRVAIGSATLVLSLALTSFSSAVPSIGSKGYARMTVPAQVVTGYYDEGTGIGKVAPYKMIALGGTIKDHYSWAKVATTPAFMPDLRIDPMTGVIYGAGPTIAQGKHQMTATVTDTKGRKANFTVGVEIVHCDSTAGLANFQTCPEISFTEYNSNRTAYVPSGKKGYDYAVALYIVAGVPPYSFVKSDGALPPGLKLYGNTGVISGVPTKVGSFDFRITVIDSTGHTARMDAHIEVKP
jgi:hypothetical protein